MLLTIQIVNYNSRDCLKDCLLSLKPFFSGSGGVAELIIINNDADPIGDFLNDYPFLEGSLKIMELNENVGFGKAHNKGFLKASGDNLLFLNPDTEVVAGSIDGMLEIFRADEKAGIAAPFLIGYDGRLQKDCFGFKKTPFSIVMEKIRGTKNAFADGSYLEVDWVSGGAMMVRKRIFSDLGGFDENFFMYFEDVDLCFQAKKKGWKIMANPAAEVRHRNGKSFSSSRDKKRYYYASQNHYLKKNFGCFPARLVRMARLPFYIKNVYFSK